MRTIDALFYFSHFAIFIGCGTVAWMMVDVSMWYVLLAWLACIPLTIFNYAFWTSFRRQAHKIAMQDIINEFKELTRDK